MGDRFDLGVAIPYLRLDMTARIDARIEHLATAPDPFVVHAFPDDEGDDASFLESGSAEGIGDMVLRGKYNFFRGTGTSVAAALDLRLPTGDADDLLGAGATQAKLYADRRPRRLQALLAAHRRRVHVLQRGGGLRGRAARRDQLLGRVRRRAALAA